MDDNDVAVMVLMDDQSNPTFYKSNDLNESYTDTETNTKINKSMDIGAKTDTGESSKQVVTWNKQSTLTLLSLYENKIHLIDHPKKKSKVWSSLAEDLRAHGIEVTPDQVRWKINALTKRYKEIISTGRNTCNFQFFNEMQQITEKCNEENNTYRLSSAIENFKRNSESPTRQKNVPFKKMKLGKHVKMELDSQWMEYLKRQEEQKQIRDERFERSLKLREEELQLRKQELEMKQAIALKKLQLREKQQEEILKIEREKCALIKRILDRQEMMEQ